MTRPTRAFRGDDVSNRIIFVARVTVVAIVLAGFMANVVPMGQIMFYLAALFD